MYINNCLKSNMKGNRQIYDVPLMRRIQTATQS